MRFCKAPCFYKFAVDSSHHTIAIQCLGFFQQAFFFFFSQNHQQDIKMYLEVCSAFRLRASRRSNQLASYQIKDQVHFTGLIPLIISLLVFYSEETWHEKQTFPFTPRGLVTNQILTINSANHTYRRKSVRCATASHPKFDSSML